MSGYQSGFREQLLASEPVNRNLQDKYQQEMEKMFTDEITGVRRIGWWANYLVMLMFGLASLANAVFNQPIWLPPVGRWLWGISGVFILIVSAVGLKIGWKRKVDLRKDSKFLAKIGSVGMNIVAFAVLFAAFWIGDLQSFTLMAPMALLIIIIGMLVNLLDRVQQGELNTRENLLEIKYTLAKLEERLCGGK
jgi:uncharacterized membrane protein YhaH (DUF805 family)